MAAAGLSWYLEQVGRYPLLTPTLELQLARSIQEWRADPDGCAAATKRRGLRARERFIQANLRLVVRVATRFKTFTTSDGFNDLIQAGNIGLVDAVERFDPVRGYRFSTYAYFWIQMRITQHLERNERTIRLPSSITYRVATIPKVIRRLMAETGREPTRADLAAALQMSEEEVDRVFLLGRPCTSLDTPVGQDGTGTLGEMLAAPDHPAEDDEQLSQLRGRLRQLSRRDREILEAAHGIGRPPEKVGAIAQRLRLPRAKVAGIIAMAERDLRMTLNPDAERPALAATVIQPVRRSRRHRMVPGQLELLLA